MRILLVVKSKAIETLGPMYLSAIIKQHGHEAKIVDIESAAIIASRWSPNVLGYSALTGNQQDFIKLNERLKKICPEATTIIGGCHATFFPQDFEGKFDYVVQGEAENWIAEFLGVDTKYPDLDSIPYPDRTDFPDMPIRDFIASRGCVSSCNYCYNATFTKMFPELLRVRIRDPKDVVCEIETVMPQFAYFQDSTFGVSIKWLRTFSQQYGQRLHIPYHVHLRPNQVNEERASLLEMSGCVSIKIALETASEKLKKLINRGKTNNNDVYIAASLLKKKKISLILQNILGLPTATIEDDLETLDVNIRCQPAYAWTSIFQPYPATGLAKICEKEGYYTGDYSEIGDNFFDKSVLNISDEQKEHVACLQRIFAFCVEMQVMPEIKDLTWEALPKFIHSTMRKIGDKRMFPGIL